MTQNTDYERVPDEEAIALVMSRYDRHYPNASAFLRSIVQGETRDAIRRLAQLDLVVARQIDSSGCDCGMLACTVCYPAHDELRSTHNDSSERDDG